jgi:hypothetical protein
VRVRDILGARLVDAPTHRVIFGIHQQIGRSLPDKVDLLVDLMTAPLRRAARCHVERLASKIETRKEPGTGDLAIGSGFTSTSTMATGIPTKRGSVFSSPDEAAARALAIARELAQDGSRHGYSVFVTDDRERQITRVRICL